ncbi:growth hormone secretagogue receptor type 1-like [Styela clava]|uniref:growth hormone secretagogue receptor type 1-like n=1 Tax=Styela clava TaxID=7725 RepID=UPI001939C7A5|nr:growth hormone secretagogue receptor type 1-like [Styela clava]
MELSFEIIESLIPVSTTHLIEIKLRKIDNKKSEFLNKMETTFQPEIYNTTPYIRPFSDEAISISASILFITMMFGIVANLVTILVIVMSEKLRSIFNFMIVSLCVSDLLSALVSPLALYRRTWGFEEWLLPGVLCKIFWSIDTWTNYVTSLHILLFATIRLLSIKWPFGYKKIKLRQIKIITAIIWFITFNCGFIPRWIWYESKKRDRHASSVDAKWPSCTLNTDWLNEYRLYYKIAYPIFIYFPMAVIAVLSPAIAIILMRQRQNRVWRKQASMSIKNKCPKMSKCEMKTQRRENHAILQLAFISGSFMFGYIPITAYTFYTTNVKHSKLAMKQMDWNFGMIAYILLRLSECLNPIFYNIASAKMRRETVAFLKKIIKCCSPLVAVRGRTNSSSSNTSETTSGRNTLDLEL